MTLLRIGLYRLWMEVSFKGGDDFDLLNIYIHLCDNDFAIGFILLGLSIRLQYRYI